MFVERLDLLVHADVADVERRAAQDLQAAARLDRRRCRPGRRGRSPGSRPSGVPAAARRCRRSA